MNCIDKVLTDEEIDNLVNEIMNIPIEKNNNCLSTYGSVNVDELISVVKEMQKIPTYDNLLKENKKLHIENQRLKEAINKAIDEIETGYFIDGDEEYSYLESWFGVENLLNILKEVE